MGSLPSACCRLSLAGFLSEVKKSLSIITGEKDEESVERMLHFESVVFCFWRNFRLLRGYIKMSRNMFAPIGPLLCLHVIFCVNR